MCLSWVSQSQHSDDTRPYTATLMPPYHRCTCAHRTLGDDWANLGGVVYPIFFKTCTPHTGGQMAVRLGVRSLRQTAVNWFQARAISKNTALSLVRRYCISAVTTACMHQPLLQPTRELLRKASGICWNFLCGQLRVGTWHSWSSTCKYTKHAI